MSSRFATLNLAARADEGAPFLVRDYAAPLVTAEEADESPHFVAGEYPPMLGSDGQPWVIRFRGADSPRARAARAGAQARFQDMITARALAESGKKGKSRNALSLRPEDITAQETADVDELVAVTVSWTIEADEGGAFECTEANARWLYEANPALREDAMRFIRDRARFFAAASTPVGAPPLTGSASPAPSIEATPPAVLPPA